MSVIKTIAIAVVGLLVFAVLAVIGGEKTIFASFWVMVAILWLLFVWLVSTVISRRAKRGDER